MTDKPFPTYLGVRFPIQVQEVGEWEMNIFQAGSDQALSYSEAIDLCGRINWDVPLLVDALRDMLAGWRYIRQTHGDLYGVGWDRAQKKAEEALAVIERGTDDEL